MTSLRRAVTLLALLVLLPQGVARAASLSVDLNHDGRLYQVSVGERGRSVLVSRAGPSPVVAMLSTRAPVLNIVAADVDRDGYLDIVATTTHGLHLWINNGHGRFVSHRPRRHRTTVLGLPISVSASDDAARSIELLPPDALAVVDAGLPYVPRGSPVRLTTAESWTRGPLAASLALRGPPPSRS